MLLEKLCNANAISGREKVIYNILENELKNDVDEIYSDKLGSFISKKGNKGLKVMLAAHMDEVGFIVKRIDDKGYIYFVIGERGGMMEAQDLSRPNGKIFRLHDDGRVPADNPFVKTPGAIAGIFLG